MSETKSLSATRRRAVQALVTAASFEEAAEKARIRPDTLWRWLAHDAEFQEAVKEERRQQKTANCIAAEALLGLAVTTLENAMQDENLPAEVRVEASRATFEIAMQLYKLTALEDRLSALEAWWKERQGNPSPDGGPRKNAAVASKRAA